MAKIFICYRSGDDAYAAALLDDRLSQVFGSGEIFRASRSILPGESYSDRILEALRECQVVLVVIGPTWAEILRQAGEGTSTAGVDWVRTEIATALQGGVRVIPILLSRTPRLAECWLPSDIADLARKQYVKFEHRNVDMDFASLVATLSSSVSPRSTTDHPARTPRSEAQNAFTVRCEAAADGGVEVDLVSRNSLGGVTGRLSGRARLADLPHLAALIARPELCVSPPSVDAPVDQRSELGRQRGCSFSACNEIGT